MLWEIGLPSPVILVSNLSRAYSRKILSWHASRWPWTKENSGWDHSGLVWSRRRLRRVKPAERRDSVGFRWLFAAEQKTQRCGDPDTYSSTSIELKPPRHQLAATVLLRAGIVRRGPTKVSAFDVKKVKGFGSKKRKWSLRNLKNKPTAALSERMFTKAILVNLARKNKQKSLMY